jgi:hypothetical protein
MKPRERLGHSPRWAAEPEKIIMINELLSKQRAKKAVVA